MTLPNSVLGASPAESTSQANPFLARLQARSSQIAAEDMARKQEQDVKIQKTVEQFLWQVRNAVASPKAGEIVMKTGLLNLHIWNSPTEEGCQQYVKDALYIEPPECVSGFDQVIEAVKAEVLPYNSEYSTRKGWRNGHTFYVINCKQAAQLNQEGNLTLSLPKTCHKTHNTPSGKSLAKLEKEYLEFKSTNKTNNLFETFKDAFEKNLSYRESLEDQISRKMGEHRAIVLRINISKPLVKRYINIQFPIVEYNSSEAISVLELAEFVNSVKRYTTLPVRCSYQQTAWEGSYLTGSVKDDSHSNAPPTTVDLIFPSGKQNVTEEEVYYLPKEFTTY